MDYETKWSYRWHAFKRAITNPHVQTKFMTILFIILAAGLLIQASYVTNVFHPNQSTQNQTISLTTPAHIYLNQPFTVSFGHLHPTTNYQVYFITDNFLLSYATSFTANSTYFETQLTAHATDVYTSNLVRLNVQNTNGLVVGSANITAL